MLGQALAILDEVMEADTRTSCSALVNVCHVIARRSVDSAALRILTGACVDLAADRIRPRSEERVAD